MTTKQIPSVNVSNEVSHIKVAAHLEAVASGIAGEIGKVADFHFPDLNISLEGVFLATPNANIPYESIFASWQEALYKILLLPDSAFSDLKLDELAAGPDFLNLDLEQLLEVPIDPHAEQGFQNAQLNQEGGVVSQLRNISFDTFSSLEEENPFQIQSVPETLTISSQEQFIPHILVPITSNPAAPSPVAPNLTTSGAFLASFGLASNSISEFYLNSYSKIVIEAHLLDGLSTFGFNVGATPGTALPPLLPPTVNAVDASFSSTNVNPSPAGTQVFPTHIILTTLQGNTLELYTANDTLAGHVRGDLIYTINNPIDTSSLTITKIDLGGSLFDFGYNDQFLYSILNSYLNSAVGQLNFNIIDDKPVTSDQTGPTAIESAIQTVGSSHSATPEIVGGQLLTTLSSPSGTLVVTPGGSAPVSTVPANATYFGADKVGAFVSMVTLTGVNNATADGVNPITQVSNNANYLLTGADVLKFLGVGITNVLAGDKAFFITDSLNNDFILDQRTGAYIYILNNALHDTNPASPAGNIGGAGIDAIVQLQFQLTDGDGSLSNISTLSIGVKDDVPVVFDGNNNVDETHYFVQHNLNASFLETTSGNLITGSVTAGTFGADGAGSIASVTIGATTITDGGAGDLDGAINGSITASTTYGSIVVDTQGTGIGDYSYTLDIAKTQLPLNGDVLHFVNDTIRYTAQDADGSQAQANLTIRVDLNETPVAVADSISTDEDTSKGFSGAFLLSNDTDPDTGDTKAIVSVDAISAKGGIITDNLDGTYSYNPNGKFESLNVGDTDTDTFTYTMKDAEGLTSTTTVTVTITGVNDAPVAVADTGSATEGSGAVTPSVKATGDVLANDSDVDNPHASLTATLIGSATGTYGSIVLNADGSYTYTVDDSNTTVNALKFGQSLTEIYNYSVNDNNFVNPLSASSTLTITIHGINDAPSGTDNTVTTLEDTAYTFTTADFGFSDPEGDNLSAVKITTLPGVGSLTDNGIAVNAGDLVSAADIAAGKLVFTPVADGNGASYASLTFQVQDDGGTSSGGVNLDQTPNTMTISVTSVNDEPQGTNNTVTALEDTGYAFTTADFGFSDPNDTPANNLFAVEITTLPGVGTLTNDGNAVNAGDFVSAADIAAGKLVFTPAADASGTGYASFTFQVQDDGGTSNGGVDTDQTPNTITVDVTAVNDAPSGADNTVSTVENTFYTFSAADFNFSDPNDTPANGFSAVKITTLPSAANGTLLDNGVAVVAGASVSAADISAGKLTFVPALNTTGPANFTFQVQDNGGTANSGVDTDQTPKTMTIDVVSGFAPTIFTDENSFGASYDFASNTLSQAYTAASAGDGFSLREAIILANHYDILTGHTDSIQLSAGTYTLTLSGSSGEEDGDLNINGDLVITGAFDSGTLATLSKIDATGLDDRIVDVASGKSLDLSHINFSGGATTGDGGGIYYEGNNNTTGDFVSIVNSSADGNGGGIYLGAGSTATFTVLNLTGNTAGGNGGGIYAKDSTLTIDNSNIGGNAASAGGGIYSDNSSTTVTGTVNAGNTPNEITTVPPVFLDLNGDGIHLTSAVSSNVYVNIDGKNTVEQVGWVSPDDGVLMYNYDGTSQVKLDEIAFTRYAPEAKTDLEGLRLAFDSNHDSILNSNDLQYNKFGIWQDANNNGKIDTGEYQTLAERGITAISLLSDNQQQTQNGNTIHGMTSYQTQDGHSYAAADVSLSIGLITKAVPLTTNDVIQSANQLDLSKVPATTAAPLPPLVTEAQHVNASILPPAQIVCEQLTTQLHQEVTHQ